MNGGILDQPTLPNQCLLGVALPADYEELISAALSGSDFVQGHLNKRDITADEYWDKNYQPLSRQLNDVMATARQLGTQVVQPFCLADMSKLSEFKVFMIIAHFSVAHQSIELSDGLHSPQDFAKAIPRGFRGILDLMVCESAKFLVPAIKTVKNGDCICVANQEDASANYRPFLYKYSIMQLSRESINYVDAVIKVRRILRK